MADGFELRGARVLLLMSEGMRDVYSIARGNRDRMFDLHYRKLRYDEGHTIDAALHETFEHIGRPIILTSIVFAAGFMIFLLSDFLPLFQFGLLATLAMAAALVGDMLLLPCLLRTFDRHDQES